MGHRRLRRPARRRFGRRRTRRSRPRRRAPRARPTSPSRSPPCRSMQLAELDDEWVSEHLGEFDTVEEWDASLRESLGEHEAQPGPPGADQGRHRGARRAGRRSSPPRRWSTPTSTSGVQDMIQQFQAQGIDLGQWLTATGQDPTQFIESMRGQSEEAVKVDLALRAVADAEETRRRGAAISTPSTPGWRCSTARRPRTSAGCTSRTTPCPSWSAQIRKSKAFDWLVHHVDVRRRRRQPDRP